MIDVRSLFAPLTQRFLEDLKKVPVESFDRKTCYPNWRVKDILSHMVQTAMGRLSRQRDAYPQDRVASPLSFDQVRKIIEQSNNHWEKATAGLSPRILLDLFSQHEMQLADFLSRQPLDTPAFFPVDWSIESSKNWLDIAREYTERWHHQQQIREALGLQDCYAPEFFEPVVETLMLGVTKWYAEVSAVEGTSLTILVDGTSGGVWTMTKSKTDWILTKDPQRSASALSKDSKGSRVRMNQETFWKFMTRSEPVNELIEKMEFSQNSDLCRQFLQAKAIMME